MINWFKSLDGYGWFCFIVLGIPGAVIGFHILGAIGLFAYSDFVGEELNLVALFFMVTVMGLICLFVPIAAMGNGGGEFGEREWSAAKTFVLTWGSFVLATIVLFVIPALVMLGLGKLGVYEYLRTLIA